VSSVSAWCAPGLWYSPQSDVLLGAGRECGVGFWGHWVTIKGRPVFIEGPGEKVIVGVVAFVCAVAVAGGGVGGTAAVGGAVDSTVGQSIQVRTTNSKNAARKGQYNEAWRRMGLKAVTRQVRRELECAVHSYGQVREFFLRTPCRSLQRRLLAISDAQGNTSVVSIAWVRMPSAVSAGRLKRLADTYGTGNVSPIASGVLELRGVQFTGKHYASRRTGSLVVIAEAAPENGQPKTEMLDGAAQVAAEFPPL
jgi:hypothetical protein